MSGYRLDPKLERVELGRAPRLVLPETSLADDGRVHVACRYGCCALNTSDVATAIKVMLHNTALEGP